MLRNPHGLVFGNITVGALLAAESAQHETYGETVGAVAIAMLLYWLAHAYADFAAQRLEEAAPLRLGSFAWTMVHELWILIGAALPLLFVLVWWATGGRLQDAVTAAIWVSAAIIVVIELVAGLRADQSGRELAVQTTVGVLLGLGVIALRVVLH